MNVPFPLNQKGVAKITRTAHLLIAIVLFGPASVWLYFILKGFLLNGHFPQEGDPAPVPFDDTNRLVIMSSVTVMFYGIISWTAIVLLRRIFTVKITSRFSMILGLIAVLLNLAVFLFCEQHAWLAD